MIAGREKKGTRWCFRIGDQSFSVASLRKQWNLKSKLLDKTYLKHCDQFNPVESDDIKLWYIAAAWATGGMIKRKLFPSNAKSLDEAIKGTHVLVGRSDFVHTAWQQNKHVYMAIFFQSTANPELINLVPRKLCGAVSNAALSYEDRLKTQYRRAIDEQITKFRKNKLVHGFLKCAMCKAVGTCNKYHIDHGTHEHSFANLMQKFLATCTVPHNSEQAIEDWQEYHSKHCRLKVTCAQCNLKQGRFGAQKSK